MVKIKVKAASSDIGFILRNTAIEQDQQISKWSVLGSRSPTSTGVGAFLGYNIEWENLITGLELNYNHVSISAANGSTITRNFTDSTSLPTGHHYFYSMTGHRPGRAAYQRHRDRPPARRFGNRQFPALRLHRFRGSSGRFPEFRNGVITPLRIFRIRRRRRSHPCPTSHFGPVTQGNAQNGSFAYGFATGGGLDVGLTPNIFVRGEYIYFAPLDGIHVTMATGRVGAGLKL